ncbi:hypothetical protein CYMTET_44985 [Cymbomonas tetramitiformis]|uniref:F-box domain-containing protein n=1 Tax=Cymbomonas tetramitiformis TaxID=36881 RepID=A0AAE0BZ45_9CHLO|nr:hypothetical protein CYMTET_44985 [Cymbomonas tetramitiformis]
MQSWEHKDGAVSTMTAPGEMSLTFHHLPAEVQIKCLAGLSTWDVLQCSQVSASWRALVKAPHAGRLLSNISFEDLPARRRVSLKVVQRLLIQVV